MNLFAFICTDSCNEKVEWFTDLTTSAAKHLNVRYFCFDEQTYIFADEDAAMMKLVADSDSIVSIDLKKAAVNISIYQIILDKAIEHFQNEVEEQK